ncbi:MAG: adenylate/guanylate cyclase domain-containing protein, partial [Ignavibacteria bacterium]
MKNLLPDFILENYKNNIFEGELNAFSMFADISGFTPMTEKLMSGGNEGAELLSDILKKIFTPTVRCVYEHGGFITNYAGDAFTSIIPVRNNYSLSDHTKKALSCSQRILQEFINFKPHKTRYGEIDLKAKIGLSFGHVEWAIVGTKLRSFYFKGNAISSCTDAQKTAKENELIVHESIYNSFNGNKKIIFGKRGKHFFIKKLPDISALTTSERWTTDTSNLTKQIFSRNFFPDTVLNANDTGEFRDVVSVFTAFDPELPKEIIEKLFKIIIDALSQYTGYLKDIDIGDKGGVIVCYFGAPISNEEDINRALSFIKLVRNKIAGEHDVINLKTGITYGKVYTGFVGAKERIQYSVIGDAVNLAARFMSRAEWNEVWVNEELYERIEDKRVFSFAGNFFFKGFKNDIPVYKFIDKQSGEYIKKKFSMLAQELPKPGMNEQIIIGRDSELKQLNETVKNIFAKQTSGIIYIIGEAGIGKSKLIKEFRSEFGASNKITEFYCYTSEIMKTPLSPFRYLLKNFFKQSSVNTQEENKRIFDNIIDIIIKRLEVVAIEDKSRNAEVMQIIKELVRTKSIIAATIDIHWDKSLYEQLEPELRFENTLFALCNLIMAECMLQPVVLEIEDIHWLDKDSAEVLKMLLNNIDRLPLAIICTSRYQGFAKKISADNNKEVHELWLKYFSV